MLENAYKHTLLKDTESKVSSVLDKDIDYLSLILSSYVYDVAKETPLTFASNLSARMNNNVYLKREDLQPIFSFKIRGAYNKMVNLSPEEKARGVIAVSAGNHAQGVALSAKTLGIKAKIVMPLLTPEIKWKNVARLGAEVVLAGDDFEGAKIECKRLIETEGLVNIHPFDDPYVIAGQGTIAVELLRQHPGNDIYAIFVSVGGGGLITGIAAYIKRICPHIKIIGVEAVDSNAMHEALKQGYPALLDQVGLFAEGAAVCQVGDETYKLASKWVDEVVLVTNDELCAAIKDVFEDTRSILEPAGALGTAGLKKYARTHNLVGKTLISIASGANMGFDRLQFVAERAEFGENREVLISAIIPETPGSFLRLIQTIHPRIVTEFAYRYSDSEQAHIFMCFNVKDRKLELPQIFASMEKQGFIVSDISDNELAKDHGRYMIGGKIHLDHEYLLSFQFPERPGALYNFLQGIHSSWNITLFHYRSKGHDVGRVLVGIQVPPEPGHTSSGYPPKFEQFLNHLKYEYTDETNNTVFKQFLS
ncbi:hypothetical protein BB560_007159 [Smittium megazygosporum]|uniref:Threonine dehydratase n=1 Tax=Smittium megazygosporum TaxID=133381 RepID=A0A2T9XYC2_9FUNG|nr:hypothetical protein BB560_007159 [Smittium megazygosporum]